MGTWAKSWWVWAVAALSVAAIVFLCTNEPREGLPETDEAFAEGKAPDNAAVVEASAIIEPSEVASAESATPVDLAPSAAAPVEALAEGTVEVSTPVMQPEESSVVESDAVPSTNPITKPKPETLVEAGDQGINAGATEPAKLDPDPVLPAVALLDPSQSAAPEIGNTAASGPAAEIEPLLGASSPPLSLAQILPPGEAPVPEQQAPSFDLVRVSPDGSALIAGRAAPGANVRVFSAGSIPIAEATASARGEFVVFLNAPSASLDMQIPAAPEGAALVVSQEDIIILPAAPDAEDTTPIVVRRAPDAVQILQPAAPAMPGNVSLDLVSYADSGAVQLAGRGQPGNVARVYADGDLAGESPIAQGGTWELEISDIAEGRYVLRVDEVSPTGDVLSRTESPFQRQFPEAHMPESFSQGAKIIVQPGNTLWLMATEAYGDGEAFLQIFTANKDTIRDPDLIYPGQIFAIPRLEE